MKTQTLYFKEGASDKVYVATLNDDGTLLFSWGRRGSTLQSLPAGPLAPAAAESLYNKKLNEKLAKGYRPGAEATPQVESLIAAARADVPKPQLLNEIGEAELLRLTKQSGWLLQQKFDGNHILLRKRAGVITGFARSGRAIAALPKPVVDDLNRIGCDVLIDGEIVGDVVHAFDVLEFGTNDLRSKPYSQRLVVLESLSDFWGCGIKLVYTARTSEEKSVLIDSILADGGEGLVLKRADAPYSAGRPNSGGPALKFKFVTTASVIVLAHNEQHRSVSIVVHDCASPLMKAGDACKLVEVGNVSIPTNHELPPAGAVVEVRYLYARHGGALYQPVYLGQRDDIAMADCTIKQLKFKDEPIKRQIEADNA